MRSTRRDEQFGRRTQPDRHVADTRRRRERARLFLHCGSLYHDRHRSHPARRRRPYSLCARDLPGIGSPAGPCLADLGVHRCAYRYAGPRGERSDHAVVLRCRAAHRIHDCIRRARKPRVQGHDQMAAAGRIRFRPDPWPRICGLLRRARSPAGPVLERADRLQRRRRNRTIVGHRRCSRAGLAGPQVATGPARTASLPQVHCAARLTPDQPHGLVVGRHPACSR